MAARVFYDAVTVRQGTGFEFEVWYATRYLRAIGKGAEWVGERRYGSPALGTYLTIFEAESSLDGFDPPRADHQAIVRVERYIAKQTGERKAAGAPADIVEADVLYPVMFRVPAEREVEFDRWYEEEHMDLLLGCPYWPMCRRFKVIAPDPTSHTHIALHYLTDMRALDSEERTRARTTAWRDRLAVEPWFRAEYRAYHRHARRGPPA
jgi:hypothetical protein